MRGFAFLANLLRRFRRFLFYFVIPLALIAMVVWQLFGLEVVEQGARTWLASQDYGDIDFEIQELGLNRAELANVQLSDQTLSARTVVLRYDPARLEQGEIERADVSGLRWQVGYRDGEFDLGALSTLIAGESGDNAGSRFVSEVSLRDAEITVVADEGVVTVPLVADLSFDAEGAISGSARLFPRGPLGAFTIDLEFDHSADGSQTDAYLTVSEGWFDGDLISALGIVGQAAVTLRDGALHQARGLIDSRRISFPVGYLPASASFDVGPTGGTLDLLLGTGEGALVLRASARAEGVDTLAPEFELTCELSVPDTAAVANNTGSLLRLDGAPPRIGFTAKGAVNFIDPLSDPGAGEEWLSRLALEGRLDLALDQVSVAGVVDRLSVAGGLAFRTEAGKLLIASDGIDIGAARVAALGSRFMGHSATPAEIRIEPVSELLAIIDPAAGEGPSALVSALVRVTIGDALHAELTVRDLLATIGDTGGGPLVKSLGEGRLVADRLPIMIAGLQMERAVLALSGADSAYQGDLAIRLTGKPALDQAIDIDRMTVSLDGKVSLDQRSFRIDLPAQRVLTLDGVRSPELPDLRLAPVAVRGVSPGRAPLIAGSLNDDGSVSWQANLSTLDLDLQATLLDGDVADTAHLTWPRLHFEARGGIDGTALTYRLRAHGDNGRIDYTGDGDLVPGSPMAFAAENLALEFSTDHLGALDLALDVGRFSQPSQPPLFAPLDLSATASRPNGGTDLLDVGLQASDASGTVVVRMAGTHDLASGTGSGALTMFPVLFVEGGTQPGRLMPFYAGLIGPTAGSIEAAGPVSWSAQGLSSDVLVKIAGLDTQIGDIAIVGVNAAVVLDRLAPPSTPPGQLIAVQVVDLGLPLTDGLIAARLDRNGDPLLEHGQWRWAGGTVTLVSSQLADQQGELMVLEVNGLELDELLNLTPEGENVFATGKLNGRIPLELRGDEYVIEGGWLESDFNGGTIRYSASDLDSGLRSGGEGVILLLDALDNFNYSRLRLDLDGSEGGEVEMGLRIRGVNPDLYGGSEFELNLNISGQLAQILRRSYETYYQVPEEVTRQLNR